MVSRLKWDKIIIVKLSYNDVLAFLWWYPGWILFIVSYLKLRQIRITKLIYKFYNLRFRKLIVNTFR